MRVVLTASAIAPHLKAESQEIEWLEKGVRKGVRKGVKKGVKCHIDAFEQRSSFFPLNVK
jgi:hypothetical protein